MLAAHGHVIVLTINFRLGLLGKIKILTRKVNKISYSIILRIGFLKTRSGNRVSNTGGNLALRDLACALRWARNNLQSFGGDPTRVTLLGHGVGAALANLLLLTSEAKGDISKHNIR